MSEYEQLVAQRVDPRGLEQPEDRESFMYPSRTAVSRAIASAGMARRARRSRFTVTERLFRPLLAVPRGRRRQPGHRHPRQDHERLPRQAHWCARMSIRLLASGSPAARAAGPGAARPPGVDLATGTGLTISYGGPGARQSGAGRPGRRRHRADPEMQIRRPPVPRTGDTRGRDERAERLGRRGTAMVRAFTPTATITGGGTISSGARQATVHAGRYHCSGPVGRCSGPPDWQLPGAPRSGWRLRITAGR